MKQGTVTIKFDEEKLNAVKQYMEKKEADIDMELRDVMNKLYEKYVPQAVREYIENKGNVPPAIRRAVKDTGKNPISSAVNQVVTEKI